MSKKNNHCNYVQVEDNSPYCASYDGTISSASTITVSNNCLPTEKEQFDELVEKYMMCRKRTLAELLAMEVLKNGNTEVDDTLVYPQQPIWVPYVNPQPITPYVGDDPFRFNTTTTGRIQK